MGPDLFHTNHLFRRMICHLSVVISCLSFSRAQTQTITKTHYHHTHKPALSLAQRSTSISPLASLPRSHTHKLSQTHIITHTPTYVLSHVCTYATGQGGCYSCGFDSYTSGTASSSVDECSCNAGFTPAAPSPCTTCMVRLEGFKAEYLYRLTFTRRDDTTNDYSPTVGGSPYTLLLNSNEHLLSLKYRPFIASWQTYLGCSAEFATSHGRTLSLIGTESLDPTRCGTEVEYVAPTGHVITGVLVDDEGVSIKVNGIVTEAFPAICSQCTVGKYKTLPGDAACTNCLAGQYSTAVGASSSDVCLNCPTNSNSSGASTEETDCICKAGSSGPNGRPTCTLCEEGKYQASTGETDCDECASGKYLDVTGQDYEGDCITCPANSGNNPAASTAEESCQCDAGSSGPSGGTCSQCAAGTYKAETGAAVCDACLANSDSPRGSMASTACSCNAGWTGPAGGLCTRCVAGTYNMESEIANWH